MSNYDKMPKVPMPECLDEYGLKPCTAEYLEQMRALCRRENYNIKCLFEEHDPLEFGIVSEHIFKCVMHEKFLCQLGWSLEQMQLIIEFFRLADGNIAYTRLHGLMISERNLADQLRECASKVSNPVESKLPLQQCGKRVFGTEPCIPSILERMRTAYRRLRMRLTDHFECCDQNCVGLVPEETFQCVMNRTIVPEAGLTERQLDAVTNYYRACGNMINYKRMADMFDSCLSLQEQIQLNYITSLEQLERPKPVNVLSECEEQQVQQILIKVVHRADRHILTTLNAVFEKFAYRQNGEATVPYLRRFFDYINTDLVESEFALLCKKYATKDYTVNFLQLVQDLEETYSTRICPQPPPDLPVGVDGPEPLDYVPETMGGAGCNSSIWGFGHCKCASDDEHTASCHLPPDCTRFYEGGPVAGGIGRAPVLGKDYVQKRVGALPGQRYSGAYGFSHAAGKPSPIPAGYSVNYKPIPGQSEAVELRGLMERMQQYLYKYRIRAKLFFQDFDPLHQGTVSANKFRRGLYNMGIGSMGRLSLSEPEFDALINFYRLTKFPSMVCWRKFDDDIESIFIQKGIEKLPTILTPSPARIVSLPNAGSTNMEDLPLRIRQIAACAVARLKHRVIIESCNIKYFFQGFDPINTGHVSRQQFKQTLSMLNYYFTPEELDAMAVLYGDDRGFNYFRLLDDIDVKTKDSGWYAQFKAGRLYQLNRPPPEPKWKENDLNRIMYKIQARMVRYRPKLDAFLRDHDIPRHDRIKMADFHRALNRAGFQLTPREVEVLACRYRSQDDPTQVDWRCFQQAVESVFTLSDLVKTPRAVPEPWRPLREMDYDKEMSHEEYCLLTSGMRRLSQRVYMRRLEFKPMFEDFDYPFSGLVSENQFHRVLHTLGLANITTPSELDMIIKRFSVIRGLQRDVDYFEFLAQLDAIMSQNPITLEEMSPTGASWVKQKYGLC